MCDSFFPLSMKRIFDHEKLLYHSNKLKTINTKTKKENKYLENVIKCELKKMQKIEMLYYCHTETGNDCEHYNILPFINKFHKIGNKFCLIYYINNY